MPCIVGVGAVKHVPESPGQRGLLECREKRPFAPVAAVLWILAEMGIGQKRVAGLDFQFHAEVRREAAGEIQLCLRLRGTREEDRQALVGRDGLGKGGQKHGGIHAAGKGQDHAVRAKVGETLP